MFAQKGDYDSESRLDCGPAASGEDTMDVLVVNGINHNSMDTCAVSPVSVLANDLHAPDSSVSFHRDSDRFHSYTKSDSKAKLNIDDTHIEAPLQQCDAISFNASLEDRSSERDDLYPHADVDSDYGRNGEFKSVTDDADSMEITSIIQSVPKLAQNFTLNVSSGVGNIAAIQNVVQSVSGGNQTLWLPTIITSSAPINQDEETCEGDGDGDGEMEEPSTTLSQLILTSPGQHFTTHPISSPLLSGTNNIANRKYSPKVQILSSITIPKHGTIASNMKGVIHANYLNQNDLSKGNASVVSQQIKQLSNSSVLNNELSSKPTVSLSSARGGPCGPGQPGHAKGSSHMSAPGSLQLKNASSVNNRPVSKSGAQSESKVGAANQPSHILSRVVPGPKISLQSVGRGLKTNNSYQYNQKSSSRSGPYPNMVSSTNIQPAMPVKIIQQQTLPSNNKSGLKTMPPSRTGIGTKGSFHGKSWANSSVANMSQPGNQKQSNYSKNVTGVVSVQKPNGKNPSQRLILQQNPNQLLSNSSPHSRTNVQYFQTCNETDNTVRYIQSYLGLENNKSNVSSNQNLTAQILQSLSQPKSMHMSQHIQPLSINNIQFQTRENNFAEDSYEQLKQIHGDPTTLLLSDDILGTEERPNLSDDSLPYHYYTLQLVMLDHTYAGSPQATASSASGTTALVINNTPLANSCTSVSSPINSPPKLQAPPFGLSSPVKCTQPNLSDQSPVHTMAAAMPSMNNNATQHTYQYGNVLSRDDDVDDAASVISSLDGDETRPTDRNGSDTETAPEGEEEGKTRCVCDFTHDDGYMICCDRCGEWQHVDCMGIDRLNIPDDYMCEKCEPRLIDRKRARTLQMQKREELTGLDSSGSESSGGIANLNGNNKRPTVNSGPLGSHKKRPLTVTTYSNTIGGVSRTLPALPALPSSTQQAAPHGLPVSAPVAPVPGTAAKRGVKRPRRVDNGRKGPKRKLPEKRMKRKCDVPKYRSKQYSSPPSTTQLINQWNESYELAMTNHYSPELRSKIARYYSNKTANSPAVCGVLTAHHCTTVPHAGGKILIATKDMKENTPIIELRGKYMLSTQHRPQPHPMGRAGSQRPGPYLFFYRFPKDSTQVCIDTRTYGNEARFVRRSCKPNAELQHCIIKGALHVYLVTINCVQSNTEISIRHESSDNWQQCACGNPKHCKQNTSGSALTHRNNGATDNLGRERRGRTRHTSSSSHFSILPSSTQPTLPKENISPKQLSSPKMDRRRKSEPESVFNCVIKQEIGEKVTPVSPMKKEEPIEESKLICIPDNVKPFSQSESLKDELAYIAAIHIEEFIKQEPQVEPNEIIPEILSPIKLDVVSKSPEALDVPIIKEEVLQPQAVDSEPTVFCTLEDTTVKQKDSIDIKSIDSVGTVRRSSTHSSRTTRATSSSAVAASESADEKSDSQNECKVQSAKDKKKMTREERKMEAIMKAFERMEKAEQRKLENRDKQSKRRESDPQQSCSVTSTSESKDCQHSEEHCNQQQSMLKGKRRRKGRARTTSQNTQRSRNRLNSADSDLATSEDENMSSLMSPPRSSGIGVSEHFTDLTPEEAHSYQELAETNIALGESINRMKVGLSSACLLVEAAVGPLETTFKFPKIKKAIMNEWLNKSPEPNPYDIGSPLEYSIPTDNNNSHPFTTKQAFLGDKSIENLVRAANTMIGSLSGGIISADSTPEKQCESEQSEPENLSAVGATADSSCPPSPIHSPLPSYSQRAMKRVTRHLSRDSVSYSPEKSRTPKKVRKGGAKIAADPSPLKRSLRSSTVSTTNTIHYRTEAARVDPEERLKEDRMEIEERIEEREPIEGAEALGANISPPPVPMEAVLLPPPQHSAKKRWLRQAISEESDSPTAESPPNEMVTPLKKRRLARESLTLEPTPFGQLEDSQYSALTGTPTKEVCNEMVFQQHSVLPFPPYEKSILPDDNALSCEVESGKNNFVEDITSSNVIVFNGNPKNSATDFSSEICFQEKILPAIISRELKVEENINNNEVSSHLYKDTDNIELRENPVLLVDSAESKSPQRSGVESLDLVDSQSSMNSDRCSESKSTIATDETSNEDKMFVDSIIGESKSETTSNVHSTETSGSSSPVLDEMDDIQKKIHSFHTENIQILKIRNKKQPKEKRKKVNLNFDLSVLDDQTVEVKLKPEKETVDGSHCEKTSSTDLDNVQSISNYATPDDSASNVEMVAESASETILVQNTSVVEHSVVEASNLLVDNTHVSELINNNQFASTNLFSENFQRTMFFIGDSPNISEASASIPDLNVIKNAIDMTTSLDTSVFKDRTVLTTADEYKNVQEILSRVNQMDSRNSVLLSGVLKDTNHSASNEVTTPTKMFLGRCNDPRLNPPPMEKPKPIRRKLSINEYRRRHSMANPPEGGPSSPPSPPATPGAADLEQDGEEEDMSRLERNLEESISTLEIPTTIAMGVFNAQPTMLERQREKLSERLRREFGLSFADDEDARAPIASDDGIPKEMLMNAAASASSQVISFMPLQETESPPAPPVQCALPASTPAEEMPRLRLDG